MGNPAPPHWPRPGRGREHLRVGARGDRVAGPPPAAHAQALVGPAAEAGRHFGEALAHHEAADRPFEHARTELAYGVALRRAPHRAAARSHLRAAFDRFDALGAAPWADRTQSELRACKQAVSRRVAGGAVDRLTPQEVQVARFVARGLSNAEVAAQLFLSRRTVDFHPPQRVHEAGPHRAAAQRSAARHHRTSLTARRDDEDPDDEGRGAGITPRPTWPGRPAGHRAPAMAWARRGR